MIGPVIPGAEIIRMIDENDGVNWVVDGVVRFLYPPVDSTQLSFGVSLICISAAVLRLPQYYTVVSPLFIQGGTWMVVLEPDASRNYDLPGMKPAYTQCRAVGVHEICSMHMNKVYARPQSLRYLLVPAR